MDLICKNVQKIYGDFHAIDDISFNVEDGSFFALIGANGAGKSTLLDIITKRIAATSGSICVDGKDIETLGIEYFNEIGIVFQSSVLDKDLSIKQNLMTRACIYTNTKEAKERVEKMITMIKMDEMKNRKYRSLSGGEKRKVDIAASLLHQPKILFLDEPTTGVDVQSRRDIWEFIHLFRKENKMTLILTTHYLEEAESANYMVLLDKGNVVSEGTPTALRQAYAKDSLFIVPKDSLLLEKQLASLGKTFTTVNGDYLVSLTHAKESITLLQQLDEAVETFEVKIGKLEDVFMHFIEN